VTVNINWDAFGTGATIQGTVTSTTTPGFIANANVMVQAKSIKQEI